MGDEMKMNDISTSTDDLDSTIIAKDIEMLQEYGAKIKDVVGKLGDIENAISNMVFEGESTIKGILKWRDERLATQKKRCENSLILNENRQMEEYIDLMENNNNLKLKMMMQDMEMKSKVAQINQRYNIIHNFPTPTGPAPAANISNISNTNNISNIDNIKNNDELTQCNAPINSNAPPPPPPPNKSSKPDKHVNPPNNMHDQLKAALASKFKNFNGSD